MTQPAKETRKQPEYVVEYAITHHGVMPTRLGPAEKVDPPAQGSGQPWQAELFTASHSSTHILWSRQKLKTEE